MSYFSAITWHEQATSDENDDDVRFVLDQNVEMDSYNDSSLEPVVHG